MKPYPLPDSRRGLWRDWCARCGAPLRVWPSCVGAGLMCEECDPRIPHDERAAREDTGNGWDNIVKALEN